MRIGGIQLTALQLYTRGWRVASMVSRSAVDLLSLFILFILQRLPQTKQLYSNVLQHGFPGGLAGVKLRRATAYGLGL